MFKYNFVPKILLSSFLALSVSLPALATYTIIGGETINSSTTGLSNNTGNGIQATTAGTYTVNVEGSVDVANNTGQGISLTQGANVTFVGTDNANLNITGSGERGIYNQSSANLTFENIDVNITNSVSATTYAICNHGVLTVTGNGNNNFNVTGNNSIAGLHIYYENSFLPEANFTDTNVNISDNNQYGILIENGGGQGSSNGTVNISSATGNNNLVINNNKYDGIFAMNGAINITNMNVEILNNGFGAQSGNGAAANDDGMDIDGKLTVVGVSGGNTMNVSNNAVNGISVAANTAGGESGLTITDMNITASGNGGIGLSNEGVVGTISSTSGAKNLIASNNGFDGLNFKGDMTIENMNIQTNSNGGSNDTYDGIENVAKLTIVGNGDTVLQAKGNGGAGITSYTSNADLNISDMNIDLSDNKYGMVVGSSGATISSASGENILSVTGNKNYGVDVSGAGTSLTLENMNGEFKNNGNIALNASGTTLNISGTSGNNTLVFDNNTGGGISASNTATTIDKVNVSISNTTGTDVVGFASSGVLEMTGNGSNALSIDTSDHGLKISASGTGSHSATIKDYNLSFTNNDTYGLWVNDSVASISSTNKNNQMYFAGNGQSIYLQSEGGTNATNAALNVSGMQITSNDAIFAQIVGSTGYTGTLNMQDSSLRLNGSDQIVYDLNKGILTLSNVTQTGATPTTLVQNAGTSTFTASNNSSILGKITDSGQLTTTLNSGTTWKMLDNSNMYALNINNSAVDMRNQTAGEYNTLTIGNSFAGSNATVYMNTNLDEPQSTDQIILSSGARATGTTNLNITDTAAASTYGTFIKGDGIKVVDAQGSAVTGSNAFDLIGKRIDTGLYIQELYYQNLGTDDESWYIRTATEDNGGGNQGSDGSYSNGNKPKPTDLTNTVASMPAVALSVVKTINSELRNRLGELRSNNPKAHNGLWARGYYKSLEVDENIKNEMDIYGFEAGYDHLIAKDRMNRTYLGIMAGYAWADKVKVHQTNGYKGKGDTTVPSVGAYLTWINKNGWYTDTVIRGFYTQMDVTNYSAQGLPITYDADNWAVAGSFEFGRRTALYQNGRNGFVVEPKAQVVYTYMPSADHKTSLGQKIKYDATHSLVTRAALMAAYRRTFANGMALEPYVQVGVAYEWLGDTDVNFISSKFKSDVSGATFEGVLGINARLSRGWHMYGDFTVEKGSVYDSWGGHLGVRYNF